eukprot:1946044-Rhodomonas_salina.1
MDCVHAASSRERKPLGDARTAMDKARTSEVTTGRSSHSKGLDALTRVISMSAQQEFLDSVALNRDAARCAHSTRIETAIYVQECIYTAVQSAS